MARCRVYHEATRLVHDQEKLVLEYDRDRDRLRRE
jgi:hypothetical protein